MPEQTIAAEPPTNERSSRDEAVGESLKTAVDSSASVVRTSCIALAVLAGLTVVGAVVFRTNPFATLRLAGGDALLGLAAALPMVFVIYVSQDLNALLIRTLGPALSSIGWAARIALALAFAVFEELLFRGVVQSVMVDWLGAGSMAIATTAALFAAGYAVTRGFFVAAFFAGCYLSALAFSGTETNLLRPIVAHATFDVLLVWLLTTQWRQYVAAEASAAEAPA